MSIRALLSTVAFLSLVAVAAPASAQTWSAEQQEILKFEEQQWGRWMFISWAGGDDPKK